MPPAIELRYGTTSGNLGQSIDVGNSTTGTISNLNDATIYYFTVAAYNAAGESQPSNQISYTTPTPSPSGAFVNGDRVVALQGVAARNTASTGGTILQVHSAGELGTVIGGPTSANGCTWWNINYDTGSDGWSTQEGYLAKATGPGATAGSGSITREVWTGISGPTVANIPVGAAPSLTDTRPSFEAPTDWADGYGTRMRGNITAPVTGNYTFWIASDDNSELWLSSLNDNPANKVRIGWVSGWTDSRQWDKFSTQKSAAVPLITRSALLCGGVAKGRRRWRQPCGGLGQSRANRPSRRAKSFQVRCSRHSMGPNPHSLGDPLARNLATIVTFSFVRIEEWTSFATSIRASPKGLYKDFG